jgi:hypothetical protein
MSGVSIETQEFIVEAIVAMRRVSAAPDLPDYVSDAIRVGTRLLERYVPDVPAAPLKVAP